VDGTLPESVSPEGQQADALPVHRPSVEGEPSRPPRRERGGRGRFRDRRPPSGDRAPELAEAGPSSYTSEPYAASAPQPQPASGGSSYGESRPVERQYAIPSAPASAPASLPPLEQQASADARPKKGWWRRIVES